MRSHLDQSGATAPCTVMTGSVGTLRRAQPGSVGRNGAVYLDQQRQHRAQRQHLDQSGATAPCTINGAGHYVLHVVSFDVTGVWSPACGPPLAPCMWSPSMFGHVVTGGLLLLACGPPLGRGAIQSASSFSPDIKDGLQQFVPPEHLGRCEAVALKNSRTASAIFAEKLHPKWGPARQLKRISLDAERTNRKRLGRLAEVVSQSEVRQVLEKAPHVPAARGASSVPAFSARIQVDILFSDDIIVLNAMAV